MRRLLIFLLALNPAAFAAPPAEPGPEIVAGANAAAWQPLFAALSGQGAIFSRFTERRWFRVRRQPVVLAGEMRLAPGHGLSLHYVAPEDTTVIVDERGLALRDGAGRTRTVPPDPRAGMLGTALLPILRFDQTELAKSFTLHAARDGADWRLDFVPRDAALAKALGSFVVFGTDQDVRRLEFRRSATQRVEIEINETARGVAFDAAAVKRYFR